MTALRATYPTQAQITRAVNAAKKAGIRVGGIEVRPDGTIAVLPKLGHVSDPAKEAWFRED